MNRAERIRLARRRSGLSQEGLARKLGVRRSAVANWEAAARGTQPSSGNLERLACVLGVAHEWLATGRGEIGISSGAGAQPEDFLEASSVSSLEKRLLMAWRSLPAKLRSNLVELIEGYSRRPRPRKVVTSLDSRDHPHSR